MAYRRLLLNSLGPSRSRRFRFCLSSSAADELLTLSISLAASSAAFARMSFVVGRASASALPRRSVMASEREMPWSVAHLSTACMSSSGSWIAKTGSRLVGGRSRFFDIALIDFFGMLARYAEWRAPIPAASRLSSHSARAGARSLRVPRPVARARKIRLFLCRRPAKSNRELHAVVSFL
jgi:hypothetical protein